MALHWKNSLQSRPGPWQEKLLPLLGERAGVREIVASLLHSHGLAVTMQLRLGSAVVSTAFFGVSPKTSAPYEYSPNGESCRASDWLAGRQPERPRRSRSQLHGYGLGCDGRLEKTVAMGLLSLICEPG
jgi:hypothetical protein